LRLAEGYLEDELERSWEGLYEVENLKDTKHPTASNICSGVTALEPDLLPMVANLRDSGLFPRQELVNRVDHPMVFHVVGSGSFMRRYGILVVATELDARESEDAVLLLL